MMNGTKRNVVVFIVLFGLFALSACGGGGGTSGATSSVVKEGVFVDAPVDGLHYKTATQEGDTLGGGKFKYIDGETVTFSVGEVALGSQAAKTAMTPIDLVPGATDTTNSKVINIVQLLNGLDDKSDSTKITINAGTRSKLTSANFGGYSDIQKISGEAVISSFVSTKLGSGFSMPTAAEAKAHVDDSIANACNDSSLSSSISACTAAPDIMAAAKLVKLKLVEGTWSFSYTVNGTSYTEQLSLSNVSKISLSTAPNLDYGVDVQNKSFPSTNATTNPFTPPLGAYSLTEDSWAITNVGILATAYGTTFTGTYSFKTDGSTVASGGCFYKIDNTTHIKSVCYPLSGVKTSSTPTTPTTPPNTATTKTATISFNISSLNQPATPINAIDISAYLPAGVTVATTPSVTGALAINKTELVVGNNMPVPPDTSISGVFTPDIRKIRIGVVTGLNTFSNGEFARLTVSYPSSITFTANDFIIANTPSFPSIQVLGSVTPTSPSIDLTNKTSTTLSVVFN